MSGTISHINRLGAVSLAALTLAAVFAPREALAGGIGSGSIWGSAHAYRDDPLTITFKGKTYTVYTSVTIVLDPMAVNVFVTEPMSNRVSAATGAPVATLLCPYPCVRATWPLLTIATEMPGIWS